MFFLAIVCAFFLSVLPVGAAPLTFTFTGAQGYDGGTVTGTFTYEATEALSATDVHGTAGNVVYSLQSWDFTAHPVYGGGYFGATSLNGSPSVMEWSNALAGSTSEFCVGRCIFSSLEYDRLLFTNGLQSLQLLWLPPTLGLPQTVADWGPFAAWTPSTGGGTWLRSNSPDGSLQVLAMLTAGQLTLSDPPVGQAVPEPATVFFLLAAMLAGWLGVSWLRLWR